VTVTVNCYMVQDKQPIWQRREDSSSSSSSSTHLAAVNTCPQLLSSAIADAGAGAVNTGLLPCFKQAELVGHQSSSMRHRRNMDV